MPVQAKAGPTAECCLRAALMQDTEVEVIFDLFFSFDISKFWQDLPIFAIGPHLNYLCGKR